MEKLPAFRPWEDKIQSLIDREARCMNARLDNARSWDAIFARVAVPIRSVFWYGWEPVHQLETSYNLEVQQASKKNIATPVLHVYTPPRIAELAVSTLPDEHDQGLWDAVAMRVFDEMPADDNVDYWAPDADALATTSLNRVNSRACPAYAA